MADWTIAKKMKIKRKLNVQLSFVKETLEDFAWKGKKLKRKKLRQKEKNIYLQFSFSRRVK